VLQAIKKTNKRITVKRNFSFFIFKEVTVCNNCITVSVVEDRIIKALNLFVEFEEMAIQISKETNSMRKIASALQHPFPIQTTPTVSQ